MMQPIEELLAMVQVGDITYMTGKSPGERDVHLVGHYWGIDEQAALSDERFIGSARPGAHTFGMAHPDSVDPQGEDYALESALPELRMTDRMVCAYRLTEGSIIAPDAFVETSVEELQRTPAGVGTLVRATLDGEQNTIIGLVHEYDKSVLPIVPISVPFFAPPFIEGCEQNYFAYATVENRSEGMPPVVTDVFRFPIRRLEVYDPQE